MPIETVRHQCGTLGQAIGWIGVLPLRPWTPVSRKHLEAPRLVRIFLPAFHPEGNAQSLLAPGAGVHTA